MGESRTLIELFEATPHEDASIARFVAVRWPEGAFCPHCRGTKIYAFSDKKTHKCAACGRRFSIKVGTIFEDSKVPLRKWLVAI